MSSDNRFMNKTNTRKSKRDFLKSVFFKGSKHNHYLKVGDYVLVQRKTKEGKFIYSIYTLSEFSKVFRTVKTLEQVKIVEDGFHQINGGTIL